MGRSGRGKEWKAAVRRRGSWGAGDGTWHFECIGHVCFTIPTAKWLNGHIQWYPILGWVNSPHILEPILVGIGMFTGGTGFQSQRPNDARQFLVLTEEVQEAKPFSLSRLDKGKRYDHPPHGWLRAGCLPTTTRPGAHF